MKCLIDGEWCTSLKSRKWCVKIIFLPIFNGTVKTKYTCQDVNKYNICIVKMGMFSYGVKSIKKHILMTKKGAKRCSEEKLMGNVVLWVYYDHFKLWATDLCFYPLDGSVAPLECIHCIQRICFRFTKVHTEGWELSKSSVVCTWLWFYSQQYLGVINSVSFLYFYWPFSIIYLHIFDFCYFTQYRTFYVINHFI